jgi:hypothetical protein
VLISGGSSANWLLLFVLLVLSVAIAWGFSGSYLYHWQMFGNTIITETYSLACGQDYVKPSDKEPVGD